MANAFFFFKLQMSMPCKALIDDDLERSTYLTVVTLHIIHILNIVNASLNSAMRLQTSTCQATSPPLLLQLLHPRGRSQESTSKPRLPPLARQPLPPETFPLVHTLLTVFLLDHILLHHPVQLAQRPLHAGRRLGRELRPDEDGPPLGRRRAHLQLVHRVDGAHGGVVRHGLVRDDGGNVYVEGDRGVGGRVGVLLLRRLLLRLQRGGWCGGRHRVLAQGSKSKFRGLIQ